MALPLGDRTASQIMRMLIVTLSAALMLLSIAPQAGAAKSHLKCGGDNLQCGSLAKVCNPKNGKCRCMGASRGNSLPRTLAQLRREVVTAGLVLATIMAGALVLHWLL